MNTTEAAAELEIREEARFVLWALRCCALARTEDVRFQHELARGFELADVTETTAAFRAFADALCANAQDSVTWHGPRCGCVSFGELFVLQALATAGERLDASESTPAPWWSGVVEAQAAAVVDGLAREWLQALGSAGIRFPRPAELVVSLAALGRLIAAPQSAPLH